jgi:hypothetical protein
MLEERFSGKRSFIGVSQGLHFERMKKASALLLLARTLRYHVRSSDRAGVEIPVSMKDLFFCNWKLEGCRGHSFAFAIR